VEPDIVRKLKLVSTLVSELKDVVHTTVAWELQYGAR